jgi:ATP-binding cassette subfamily B protein
VGAALFLRGELSIGAVYMIAYYTALIIWPLQQLSAEVQDLQQASAGIKRVQQLRDEQPAIVDGPGVALPSGPPAVELDGVSFWYERSQADKGAGSQGDNERLLGTTDRLPLAASPAAATLQQISFAMRPGETLGLLGRTGAGKTTLIRLLLRLYDPDAGAVRLAGVDLRQLRLAELRRRVGVVTQDVQLFRASVRDNLALFDRSISDARLLEALDAMELGPWLRSLPAGLDTRLSVGGEALSAGEAQLLAFARVLLRDPGLLILDEASSRLDPATERRIQLATDRLLQGRTGIVIAHKLATVRRVDTILILDAGRIVEHGPRAALAADPSSRFAALLRIGLEEVLP